MRAEVLYNETSNCVIVAEPRQLSASVWTQELRYRHISASNYTSVRRPSEQITYRDPKSCGRSPILLFNVWSVRTDVPGGYDWKSIDSLNLATGRVSTVMSKTNLLPPENYAEAWPSTLVAAKEAGDGVICSAGLRHLASDKPSVIEYWLCEITFASGEMSLLTQMADVVI